MEGAGIGLRLFSAAMLVAMTPVLLMTAGCGSKHGEAGRTAAVAKQRTSPIPIMSQRTRNRCSAVSALATPSSGNKPVVATPLPRPHNAFSLNVGVGAREYDS